MIDSRSRVEDILNVILGNLDSSVLQPPQSRVEDLLQKLNEMIGDFDGKIPIHICTSGEYDHETLMPTIEDPEENAFYLVPANESGDDMYIEWIYTEGNRWERFGSGGGTVTIEQSDWNQNDSTADDYIKNKPDLTLKLDKNQGSSNSGKVMVVNSIGNLVPTKVQGGNITVTETPIDEDDYELGIEGDSGAGGDVSDVKVNGTSVVTQGVANIPNASSSGFGVVRIGTSLYLDSSNILQVSKPSDAQIKAGTLASGFIPPSQQHIAAFFGLAKAAGDATQVSSSNAVGNYTESAKSAISEMLGGSIAVTGTTPSITALPGVRYVCGEVSTIDITVPATGIIDVVFTSGATPAVLTVTPPTGITEVEWVDGFDPDNLSANATYWLKVFNGKLGVATAWGVQSGGGGEKPWNHVNFEVLSASEQISAFIIPNNNAISEILVKGKALFDSYDGIFIFINDVALLTPKTPISSTTCFFQLYGRRIAADQWIGRGDASQWLATPKLLDVNANTVGDDSKSNGIGDIKIASRWTNKIFQIGTTIDVYWR